MPKLWQLYLENADLSANRSWTKCKLPFLGTEGGQKQHHPWFSFCCLSLKPCDSEGDLRTAGGYWRWCLLWCLLCRGHGSLCALGKLLSHRKAFRQAPTRLRRSSHQRNSGQIQTPVNYFKLVSEITDEDLSCNATGLEELEGFVSVNRAAHYGYLTLNSLFVAGCVLQCHFHKSLKRNKSSFVK